MNGPNGTNIDWKLLPPPHSFNTRLRCVDRAGCRAIWIRWPGRDTCCLLYEGDDRTAPLSANPDLAKALAGEVSGRVWLDGDGHLTLTAAAPVQQLKLVLGAVLLSRDGDGDRGGDPLHPPRHRQGLRSARWQSRCCCRSISQARSVGRLRRLARAAERLRLGVGGAEEIPDFSRRHDEIGELSLALREMTAALRSRMDAIERFAADVAHELKNPLSSLSSAVETVGRVKDPAQKERLLGIIREDVTRLDRLISDISERVAASTPSCPAPNPTRSTSVRVAGDAGRYPPHRVGKPPDSRFGRARNRGAGRDRTRPATRTCRARVWKAGLGQVFQNLISNAVSFSPAGRHGAGDRRAPGRRRRVITVADQGPGIPLRQAGGDLRPLLQRAAPPAKPSARIPGSACRSPSRSSMRSAAASMPRMSEAGSRGTAPCSWSSCRWLEFSMSRWVLEC